jgi:hypothetical protein
VSISVHFVSEGQVARAPAVIFEGNVTLLFGGGLDSSQYAFLYPEENGNRYFGQRFFFEGKLCQKHFLSTAVPFSAYCYSLTFSIFV